MIASERSHQDLSETILTLFDLCEKFIKFRHSFIVIKDFEITGRIFQCVKNKILLVLSKNIRQQNFLKFV